MRRVYLQPAEFEDPPAPFRRGEAGLVWLGADETLHTDTRVRLSANATHALEGHGVLDALNELPLEGLLGEGRDVIVPQRALTGVSELLYEADRKTYGGSWEFVLTGVGCEGLDESESVEYRIRVDNRDYQRNLLRLTDLLALASRRGHAARLRL